MTRKFDFAELHSGSFYQSLKSIHSNVIKSKEFQYPSIAFLSIYVSTVSPELSLFTFVINFIIPKL